MYLIFSWFSSELKQWHPRLCLGIASLLEVRAELKEAIFFWQELGLAFGLLQNTLELIKLQNQKDIGQCLTETLAAWLQGRDSVAAPTQRAIAEVLLRPTFNFYRLALRISDTYHHGRSDSTSPTTGSEDPLLHNVDDTHLGK